jgi:actin-related protein
LRAWEGGYLDNWRKRTSPKDWGRDYELWKYDVRDLDMGLLGDRVERALREAFTKYLLIDTRPRRMVAVLPSVVPLPLLSSVLDTFFHRFQSPSISLLSAAVTATVAAGLRSALVVDLGYSETVVTAVYEYREIHSSRTVRGGRMLVEQMHKLLKHCLAEKEGRAYDDPTNKIDEYIASFDECEDLTSKLCWCKPATKSEESAQTNKRLSILEEEDEFEDARSTTQETLEDVEIPLSSTEPPTVIRPSFERLSEPCEHTFFDPQRQHNSFDDEEIPVHLLIYRSLLQLPLDVRAVCMSRIIFTGGCSNVLGLRGRIFDEVSHLVEERGWTGVTGKVIDEQRAKPGARSHGSGQAAKDGGGSEDTTSDAATANQERDPVEEQLRKAAGGSVPTVQGSLRCINSLGSWSGGSMVTQLKVPAIATIDREVWLQQGAAGASKPGDVDAKPTRQSMAAGGLIRGAAAAGSNWTLGIWGAV